MKHDVPAAVAQILTDGGVPRETLERLAIFVDLVLRWTDRINLIARADRDLIWDRHVLDAAQLQPLIPSTTTMGIDLGSGGGFPGIVLAVLTGLTFHLIEADQRKAAFLREAARATAAAVQVHAMRIEQAQLPPAELVTARALAPLPRLLPMVVRFVAPDGVALLPKGRGATAELTEAAREWHMDVKRVASRTRPDGTILCIRNLRRAGPAR